MNKAIDLSSIGVKKEITAEQLVKVCRHSISAEYKRYACPRCGEYVTFVHGSVYVPYFKHQSDSNIAKRCDLFIQGKGISSFTAYDNVGLPLYLYKIGNSFGLYIGFYGISENAIILAEKSNLIVNVYSDIKDQPSLCSLRVNLKEFESDKIKRVQLNEISSIYYLKFTNSNVPHEIINRWPIETVGIDPYGGAMFLYSSGYGRRLPINGDITTDTNYSLVTRESIPDRVERYIEKETIGPLALSQQSIFYHTWKVYRVKFNEINEVTIEFCRQFKVNLVYDPIKITPVWPPNIQYGNRIFFRKPCNAMFLIQSSEEENRTAYSQYSFKAPEEFPRINLNSMMSVVNIRVSDVDMPVSIGHEYNPMSFITTSKAVNNVNEYQKPNVIMEYGGKPLTGGDIIKTVKKSELWAKSDIQCDFHHYKRAFLKKIKKSTDHSSLISDILPGDELLAYHGLDPVFDLKFVNKLYSERQKQIESDYFIYKRLLNSKGGIMVSPVPLKYLIANLDKYPKTRQYIYKAILSGEISKSAFDHIVSSFFRGNLCND